MMIMIMIVLENLRNILFSNLDNVNFCSFIIIKKQSQDLHYCVISAYVVWGQWQIFLSGGIWN